METDSEPYVRLTTLRQLHQVMADMNTARSLADTLQTVADGVVTGDEGRRTKQPDWSYCEDWSGSYPADSR